MAEAVALFRVLFMAIFVAFSTGEDVSIDDVHSPFSDDVQRTIDVDPVHRIFTQKELASYDGKNSGPIYMAVKGVIFDVTSGKEFYGPGGPYNKLTGKDASRAVAMWSVAEEDLNDNLDGLTAEQLNNLENVFSTVYMAKYPVVGYLKGHEPVEDNMTFKRRKMEL